MTLLHLSGAGASAAAPRKLKMREAQLDIQTVILAPKRARYDERKI